MENPLEKLFQKCSRDAKSIQWFKVVFAGDAYVGKTSIIKAFCNAEFNPKYTPTVGVDYGFKVVDALRVHMWDLSGNPFFKDTRNELYEQSDLCVLVYDVTSRKSFESLESFWIPEMKKYDIGDALIVCLGNKSDKLENGGQDGSTKRSEVETWCVRSGGMRHFQVSAATGDNIHLAMNDFIKSSLNKNRQNSSLKISSDCSSSSQITNPISQRIS